MYYLLYEFRLKTKLTEERLMNIQFVIVIKEVQWDFNW